MNVFGIILWEFISLATFSLEGKIIQVLSIDPIPTLVGQFWNFADGYCCRVWNNEDYLSHILSRTVNEHRLHQEFRRFDSNCWEVLRDFPNRNFEYSVGKVWFDHVLHRMKQAFQAAIHPIRATFKSSEWAGWVEVSWLDRAGHLHQS